MFRFTRHDAGLLVVSLIWGANFSVTKNALAHIGPVPFAAMRFVLSSLLLLVVVRRFGGASRVPRHVRRGLLGLGIVGHTLNQIAFVGGLKLTTATNSALIFASLPLVVAVMGLMLGHERPEPRVWLAIVLGTVGVAVVVAAKGVRFSSTTFQGDLVTLVAVLLWAAFTVGVRRVSHGIGSLEVTMYTHLGGTPGLVLAAAPGAAGALEAIGEPAVWGAVLYSAVASSLIAAVLWTRGLQALGGSRTALYSGVTPLFAGLIAWVALDERPAPLQALGAVLVVGAVLLSTSRPRGDSAAAEPA